MVRLYKWPPNATIQNQMPPFKFQGSHFLSLKRHRDAAEADCNTSHSASSFLHLSPIFSGTDPKSPVGHDTDRARAPEQRQQISLYLLGAST